MNPKKDFFLECYQHGIIKFGQFTLKSGIQSPFYVDLRPLSSNPKILKLLSKFLLEMLPAHDFDLVCGVPYAGLPIATAISLECNQPLIMKRKEAKSYGTKKLIEGIYKKGQNCILIEDVITSGKSLLETIPEIENEGIKISDVLIVLDREQGGKKILEDKGFHVHSLFTISEVCEYLKEENLLKEEEYQKIKNFLAGKQIVFEKEKRFSYEQKLEKATHPFAKKLLEIAIEKKSNLIAAADVITRRELLDFAEKVGPHIVALKTHIDIITDFDFDKTILPLKDIAKKYNFLLMEDRKFADIGNTQELQYSYGIYRISSWADLVTSQVIGGENSLDYFLNSGIIAIVGMSSQGTLTDAHYREEAMNIVKKHHNVIGCVSQDRVNNENILLFTPGVNIGSKRDDKGQQYNAPDYVFSELFTDFIIVGRGIYKASEIEKTALNYQIEGWNAYQKTL